MTPSSPGQTRSETEESHLQEMESIVEQLRQRQEELERENARLRSQIASTDDPRLYESLYSKAPVGYVDFDAKGAIVRINDTGAAWLGRTAQSLVGKPFIPFIATKDIQRFLGHLQECLKCDGTRQTTELRLRADGEESVSVQMASVCTRVQDDELVCRTAFTDITERRLAEEALRESKECFRIMTDTAPVLVWMSSPTGDCTYFNKAWTEFTGRPLREDLGSGWLDSVHREDLPAFKEAYDGAFDSREKFNIEFRLRRADGEFRWFLNTGVPRFTPTSEFAGFIGSCIDITERKEAEVLRRQILEDLEVIVQERTANLKDANKKLRSEVLTRKRLEKQIVEIADLEQRRIGNDLHDGLGQQLTGIAFLSKVLQQKLKAKNLPETVDATKVHDLVNDSLSKTRELARGLHVVELEAGGLPSALQELRNQVETLYSLQCDLKCEKTIPIADTTVATHVFRITQEAVNNAIKHGKANHIRITLSRLDKRRVQVSVRDDGVGIPAGKAKSGMGMHTMRYRTEMIGGDLSVQRAPDKGTLVTCTFTVKPQK